MNRFPLTKRWVKPTPQLAQLRDSSIHSFPSKRYVSNAFAEMYIKKENVKTWGVMPNVNLSSIHSLNCYFHKNLEINKKYDVLFGNWLT